MIKWLGLPPGSSAFSGCFGISLRNYYSLKPKDREWTQWRSIEWVVLFPTAKCLKRNGRRAALRQFTVKDPLRRSFISHTDKRPLALLRPSVQQSSYWGQFTTRHGPLSGAVERGWLVGWPNGRPEFISFHSKCQERVRKLGFLGKDE